MVVAVWGRFEIEGLINVVLCYAVSSIQGAVDDSGFRWSRLMKSPGGGYQTTFGDGCWLDLAGGSYLCMGKAAHSCYLPKTSSVLRQTKERVVEIYC